MRRGSTQCPDFEVRIIWRDLHPTQSALNPPMIVFVQMTNWTRSDSLPQNKQRT
jgi:hypothetical protein